MWWIFKSLVQLMEKISHQWFGAKFIPLKHYSPCRIQFYPSELVECWIVFQTAASMQSAEFTLDLKTRRLLKETVMILILALWLCNERVLYTSARHVLSLVLTVNDCMQTMHDIFIDDLYKTLFLAINPHYMIDRINYI